MFILQLAATEGRRIHQVNQVGDAFTSLGSSNTPDKADNKRPSSLDLDMRVPSQLPTEQLAAMAAHMDAFAKKAPTTLLARAERMAYEMSKLSTDSSSSTEAGSSLPQDLAAMLADEDFQKQAQEFAKSMQKNAKGDTDLHSELEPMANAMSSQQMSAKRMSNTEFQEFSRRVTEAVGFLMRNPGTQEKSLAAHEESVKKTQVGEDIAEMFATAKLKAMPFAVVSNTVAEAENGVGSVADDAFREELNALAAEPTHKLFAAMEALGTTPEVNKVNKARSQKPEAMRRQTLPAARRRGLESVADDEFRQELNALAAKPTKKLFAAMEAIASTPEAALEAGLAPSG